MNLYDALHFSAAEEVVTELLRDQAAGLRVERILSSGQSGGVYDQDENEWLVLLEGEAVVSFLGSESARHDLRKGDCLWIPAHQQHRVDYSSERCIWLCVFTSVR